MPDIEKIRHNAKKVLLNNYHATGGDYITPAWPHYKNQWLWDSSFHAVAAAELGMVDLAKNEITTLLRFQHKNGWIPHRIYHGIFPWFDLERFLYGKSAKPLHSSLVGMPVLAQAVEAIDDKVFWKKVLPNVVSFYKYFIEERDALNMLSIISPRESGRDASPEFDFFRPHLPRGFRWLDRFFDPLFVIILHWRYRRYNWDVKELLKVNIFHVKDPVSHCLWLDGLYSLRNMLGATGQKMLFGDIEKVIKRAEKVLIEVAWDEKDKTFYPLRAEYGKIRENSLSAVFPLLSENLPENIKKNIIKKLKDSEWFATPYPVPSVPVNHPSFNAKRTFPIWRGPTWINVNWFMIRALKRHGYDDMATTIAEKSLEMIEREGYREFYDPYTGEGKRVHDFGWSTLAVTFPRLTGEKQDGTHTDSN